MSQMRFLKVLLAILALVICTGTLQATATIVGPASITLSCDTLAGPSTTTVNITLASGTTPYTVKVTGTSGLLAPTGPVSFASSYTSAGLSVTSTSTATVFSVTMAPGCQGTVPGGTPQLIFTPTGSTGTVGTVLNIPVVINITTSNGSALVPSPSSLTFTCNKTSGAVTSAQTVSVSSAATGGTPFTIGSLSTVSSWLSVSAGGTASSTPVVLTVTATGGVGAGCTLLASGTTTFNIQLLNAPAPAKIITVSMVVGSTSPLTAATSPVALTYTQGSASSNWVSQTSSISSNPANLFFQVDLTTVPSWLSVSPASGNATQVLTFLPGSGVTGLYLGNYTAYVHLKVSGYLDCVLPVTIQVNSAAATLSLLPSSSAGLVATGTNAYTETINWTIGTTLAPFTVTPVSSDTPIAFTVGSSGSLAPIPSVTQGLAYNFGSPFTVSISPTELASLAPSATPTTGTVTVTGNSTTITVTIKLYVEPAAAQITSLSPSILPTATAGSVFVVAITGTGFVPGTGTTVAGVVPSAGVLVVDPNITVSVQDSTSIVLTITVPATTDIYLPFSGSGGTVTIGVCNPPGGGSVCSTPAAGGTAVLTIGINPIVSAVTNAASYIEATSPTLPIVAPYDILSIFGTNFCVSSSTGCVPGTPSAILYATPGATTGGYPFSLSPDSSGATQRNLVVSFYQHGTTTLIAAAPLLFATNSQINLMAPAALTAKEGSTVDIVVSFGYGTAGSATLLKSQAYSVSVAATDPGVFTIGGDGQGSAAALNNASYALITSTGPAMVRTNASNSDVIDLYVTGLGVPDSTFTGTAGSGGTGASATCMTAAAYWANDTGTTSDDGLVIEPAFYTAGAIEPCFLLSGSNIPTVTVGGQPASVLWAGWVQGAVAGLYQIDVQLPSSTPTAPSGSPAFTYAANDAGATMGSAPVSLPVVVTAGSKNSQVGADLWVEQGLLATVSGLTSGELASPSVVTSNPVYTVTLHNGTPLPEDLAATALTVAGAQGTGPYAYSSASAALQAGADLTLNSDGTITGTPGSDMIGTTTVVITVTDSSATALTGTVTINFVIS